MGVTYIIEAPDLYLKQRLDRLPKNKNPPLVPVSTSMWYTHEILEIEFKDE
jgi:hypothetical protein